MGLNQSSLGGIGSQAAKVRSAAELNSNLMTAAAKGDLASVKALAGRAPSAVPQALSTALHSGQSEVVAYLLPIVTASGLVDPDKMLALALNTNKLDAIKYIAANGASRRAVQEAYRVSLYRRNCAVAETLRPYVDGTIPLAGDKGRVCRGRSPARGRKTRRQSRAIQRQSPRWAQYA